jgi:hypothetical protein
MEASSRNVRGRGQGLARIPPLPDEEPPEAPRSAQCGWPRKGDWGKPLPVGVHRGIAQFMGYGSYSAATAEGLGRREGQVKVHRMVLALNCGHAVNPGQIAAQVEGSVAYGLTATLYGEMVIDKGPRDQHQLRHLRDHAPRRDAQGRDGDRADLRLLGRRRRADHLRGRARGAQRRSTRRPASRCASCR